MERTKLLYILTGTETPKFITERENVMINKFLEILNKGIECPSCHNLSDRLHRYNSGEPWLCPSCYIGRNCFPTPQTEWSKT